MWVPEQRSWSERSDLHTCVRYQDLMHGVENPYGQDLRRRVRISTQTPDKIGRLTSPLMCIGSYQPGKVSEINRRHTSGTYAPVVIVIVECLNGRHWVHSIKQIVTTTEWWTAHRHTTWSPTAVMSMCWKTRISSVDTYAEARTQPIKAAPILEVLHMRKDGNRLRNVTQHTSYG